MNILYIGPYNTKNIIAYSSIDIIESLAQDDANDLTIRAFELAKYDRKDIFVTNQLIKNLSNKYFIEKYDVVIQHAPILDLVPAYEISLKNIAIPLFSPSINNQCHIEKLTMFDQVLVDNDADKNFLAVHNMVQNAQCFEYSNISINYENLPSEMDLTIYNNTIKYYAILDEFNADHIKRIIESFYYCLSIDDSKSLLVFISSNNAETRKKCSELLQSVKHNLNYHSNNINIKFIVQELSMKDIIAIHYFGDIYLNLSLSNYDSINKYICKKLNKPLIGLHMVTGDGAPYIENNKSSMGAILPYISYTLLISCLRDVLNNPNKYIDKSSHPNIKDIICQ